MTPQPPPRLRREPSRCIYDCDCDTCALIDERDRLKTERDSYRTQVTALLVKLGECQKCNHGEKP